MVIQTGAECLRIAAIAQPLMAITDVYAGALRGAGDTRTPMYVAIGGLLSLDCFSVGFSRIDWIWACWVSGLGARLIGGSALLALFSVPQGPMGTHTHLTLYGSGPKIRDQGG